jgi:hypothetical protein
MVSAVSAVALSASPRRLLWHLRGLEFTYLGTRGGRAHERAQTRQARVRFGPRLTGGRGRLSCALGSPGGGIDIPAGLKIQFPQGSVGSTPSPGTICRPDTGTPSAPMRTNAAQTAGVHSNPVGHGPVASPAYWPYSTFRPCVTCGPSPPDWDERSGEADAGRRTRPLKACVSIRLRLFQAWLQTGPDQTIVLF